MHPASSLLEVLAISQNVVKSSAVGLCVVRSYGQWSWNSQTSVKCTIVCFCADEGILLCSGNVDISIEVEFQNVMEWSHLYKLTVDVWKNSKKVCLVIASQPRDFFKTSRRNWKTFAMQLNCLVVVLMTNSVSQILLSYSWRRQSDCAFNQPKSWNIMVIFDSTDIVSSHLLDTCFLWISGRDVERTNACFCEAWRQLADEFHACDTLTRTPYDELSSCFAVSLLFVTMLFVDSIL